MQELNLESLWNPDTFCRESAVQGSITRHRWSAPRLAAPWAESHRIGPQLIVKVRLLPSNIPAEIARGVQGTPAGVCPQNLGPALSQIHGQAQKNSRRTTLVLSPHGKQVLTRSQFNRTLEGFRPIKHIGQQFSIQENVGPVVCGPKEEGRLNRLGHSEALPQPNLIVLLWVPRPPDPKGLMTWLILGRNRPRVGPLGKPTLGRPRSHKNRGQQDSSH